MKRFYLIVFSRWPGVAIHGQHWKSAVVGAFWLIGIGWLLAGVGTTRAGAAERAFWVWNRAAELTAPERAALTTAGVDRLYWQAGELELQGGKLVLRRTAAAGRGETGAGGEAGPRIVPVVRVSTAIRSPEQFGAEALGELLRTVAEAAPGREVQIDFDCPDRLLPVYAERLRVAREIAGVRRLSVTALAGWVETAEAAPLWTVVDAVYPMLYDTRTDPAPVPGDPTPCRPRALLDPDELGRRLRAWRRCPIPWYAGLPVFARVTLYDAAGRSRGHLRSWDWNDVIFNSALRLDRPVSGGTTVLRASGPTRVGENPVAAGGYVAVRTAERSAIRAGVAQADAAGARGVVFFRLPDPVAPFGPTGGGWSLPQVTALLGAETAPRVTLQRAGDGGERWVLRNDSEVDLAPRFDAVGRGYGLEVEFAGGAPGWREALAGDFLRVVGHRFEADGAGPGEKPVAVVIPLAQRLTFWFAALPAHSALTTGLVQLAPGLDPAAMRYRVPVDGAAETFPWQPIR